MQASRLAMLRASAEGADELQRELIAGCLARADFAFPPHFAARRQQVEFANRERENAVIDSRPDRPDDEQPERAVRFREEHDVIDEPVREGEAVFDAQRDAHEVGHAREQRVDGVEHRRDKEKRELDRLGDAGEKRGQRRGNHDAADLRALLRTRRAPHRECRCRQSPHFEEITAGHVARGRIAGDEARDFAVNHVAGGRIGVIAGLEKERHIPDVMQPERNERALDDAIDREGQRRPPMHRPMRESFDRVADRRPDEAEHRARRDDGERGDDRHGAFARKEAEIARELYS